jgi:MFS transporter, ACS family, allantoate permease
MMAAITLFTMDKATLSYSSIMGIQHDAHLTPNEYSWLGSIFSLGYMFANFPCALIIQKVPLSKWVVITMSIWGVLLASMAAGKNYGSLFAIRLLLGYLPPSSSPNNA